jgi:hypothetical protein
VGIRVRRACRQALSGPVIRTIILRADGICGSAQPGFLGSILGMRRRGVDAADKALREILVGAPEFVSWSGRTRGEWLGQTRRSTG